MKNGLLIWNAVLTVLAGYLLFAHFNSSKKNVVDTKPVVKDSSAGNLPFRVAYFEMDSIEMNLYIVRDWRKEMTKIEEENDRIIEKLRSDFQKKFYDYQAQMQSGKMTQAQAEAANQDIKRDDDNIRNKKQELDSKYNEEYSIYENSIKKEIQEFLKEYNKEGVYAYIFANQPGLFYYCDTAYNITPAIIKGMNERYKSKNKKQ